MYMEDHVFTDESSVSFNTVQFIKKNDTKHIFILRTCYIFLTFLIYLILLTESKAFDRSKNSATGDFTILLLSISRITESTKFSAANSLATCVFLP